MLLLIVTSATPEEFTLTCVALNVPLSVLKLTEPAALPVTVAVIVARSVLLAAMEAEFTDNVKVSPLGEVGRNFPLVLSQPVSCNA